MCLIPMGGVLPTHPQRVLGIGGTAGMVLPSTGERRVRCQDVGVSVISAHLQYSLKVRTFVKLSYLHESTITSTR